MLPKAVMEGSRSNATKESINEDNSLSDMVKNVEYHSTLSNLKSIPWPRWHFNQSSLILSNLNCLRDATPFVKNILLLDSEGKHVAVKYFLDDWPTNSAKLAFVNFVFTKTQKTKTRTKGWEEMDDPLLLADEETQPPPSTGPQPTVKEQQPTEHHSPETSKGKSPFLQISPKPSLKASNQPKPSPEPYDYEATVEEYAEENDYNRTQIEKTSINYLSSQCGSISESLKEDSKFNQRLLKAAEGYIQNSAQLTEIANSLKIFNLPSFQSRITNIENTQVTMQFHIASIKTITFSMTKMILPYPQAKRGRQLNWNIKVRIAGLDYNRSLPEGVQVSGIHIVATETLLGYMVMAGNVRILENQRFCVRMKKMIDKYPDKVNLQSKKVKLEALGYSID
nr:coatomer subunit zeta-1-like [Tanacetum cinerariifolium]